jgi:organic radical activating enzyme
VRFAGCNLECPWCDTNHGGGLDMTAGEILEAVLALGCGSVILTGGEPLLQAGLETLLALLKTRGLWLGIETNGTINPAPGERALLDYIATSPKAGPPISIAAADEVRVVAAPEVTPEVCEDIRGRIEARRYYLSPCERGGEFNILHTIALLGTLNERTEDKWLLSIQTHKLAKIP